MFFFFGKDRIFCYFFSPNAKETVAITNNGDARNFLWVSKLLNYDYKCKESFTVLFEVFDYLKPYIKALLYRDEFSGPLRLDIKLQLMLRKIDNNCGCERHYITPDEKANAMESNKLWLRMDNDYYEFLYLSNSRN